MTTTTTTHPGFESRREGLHSAAYAAEDQVRTIVDAITTVAGRGLTAELENALYDLSAARDAIVAALQTDIDRLNREAEVTANSIRLKSQRIEEQLGRELEITDTLDRALRELHRRNRRSHTKPPSWMRKALRTYCGISA